PPPEGRPPAGAVDPGAGLPRHPRPLAPRYGGCRPLRGEPPPQRDFIVRCAARLTFPRPVWRLHGLRGTPYEQAFLRLPHNARLIEAADALGCLPEELEALAYPAS